MPARIFALLGLVACTVALIMVISAGLDESGDSADPSPEQTTIQQGGGGGQGGQGGGRARARYVVQNGDTLTSISEQTGVSIDRIQELNPDLDPQILISGQRIRLR